MNNYNKINEPLTAGQVETIKALVRYAYSDAIALDGYKDLKMLKLDIISRVENGVSIKQQHINKIKNACLFAQERLGFIESIDYQDCDDCHEEQITDVSLADVLLAIKTDGTPHLYNTYVSSNILYFTKYNMSKGIDEIVCEWNLLYNLSGQTQKTLQILSEMV